MPFSDPLADGPVIHAAGTRRAARRAPTLHGVLEVGRTLADAVPVVLMCYANLVLARGPERFADELAERGISGLIVPDLPLEEAGDALAACDAVGRRARRRSWRRRRAEERLAAIGRSARGFVYTVAVTGTTGEREGLAGRAAGDPRAHEGRTPTCPVALGFGIGTPEAAAQVADAGRRRRDRRLAPRAGGGASRRSPAAAVRDLVAGFAAALR